MAVGCGSSRLLHTAYREPAFSEKRRTLYRANHLRPATDFMTASGLIVSYAVQCPSRSLSSASSVELTRLYARSSALLLARLHCMRAFTSTRTAVTYVYDK